MRERPVGPKGLPVSDPFCRRCDGEAEKPNLLCVSCRNDYRTQYGISFYSTKTGMVKFRLG